MRFTTLMRRSFLEDLNMATAFVATVGPDTEFEAKAFAVCFSGEDDAEWSIADRCICSPYPRGLHWAMSAAEAWRHRSEKAAHTHTLARGQSSVIWVNILTMMKL